MTPSRSIHFKWKRSASLTTTGFILAGIVALVASCVSPPSPTELADIYPSFDLAATPDGIYNGSSTYRGFTYQVETIVKEHRIADIRIVNNKQSRHGIKAAGVVPLIIAEQRVDVDGISGATLCSTGLKSAVAKSLHAARAPLIGTEK